MDWNSAMEEDRQTLRRIAAILFAFAILAERSCDRSRAVRGFVLWILRCAEDIARDFVLDTADDYGVSVQLPASAIIPTMHGGDSVADAIRLVHSFRTLAALLEWLADQNCQRRVGTSDRAAGFLHALARLLADTRPEQGRLYSRNCLSIERLDSS